MNSNLKMNIEDYMAAKEAYTKNENVTSVLKKRLGIDFNTPEIIAAAYDLQAGTYSANAEAKLEFYQARVEEVVNFIESNISNITSALDVGSGELTMFSRVASKLSSKSKINFFATDISLSRLIVGRNWLKSSFDVVSDIELAVADTAKLPFGTKSMDIVITDHSLEPNGAQLQETLRECFRVAKRYCVFIEPSNSLQAKAGLERMKSLGYIFDLETDIKKLGGKIVCQHLTINNYNQLNKSKMLIVETPQVDGNPEPDNHIDFSYTYPGSNHLLEKNDNFLFSEKNGFLFPVVDSVPLLLEQNRILYSKYRV